MSKKTRFILILLYIVFLIGLTEGLARLVFLNSKLSDRLWVYEDLSWRRSWIKRHNNSGMEIYYTFDIYDSSKGWISKPNIKDMQVFDNKVLNTNSKGFRGKTNSQKTYPPPPSQCWTCVACFPFKGSQGQDIRNPWSRVFYFILWALCHVKFPRAPQINVVRTPSRPVIQMWGQPPSQHWFLGRGGKVKSVWIFTPSTVRCLHFLMKRQCFFYASGRL